jgi:hypothetical protein
MKTHAQTISFSVVRIIEENRGDVTVFTSVLREYSTGVEIKRLGKPWKIGTKVDFALVQVQEPHGPPRKIKAH